MDLNNEKNLENFIRKNRDKFGDYNPTDNHTDKFLSKFNRRFRHLISIVPYLVRVAIVTILIFFASILTWDKFIRKDRDQVSLKSKITHILDNTRH